MKARMHQPKEYANEPSSILVDILTSTLQKEPQTAKSVYAYLQSATTSVATLVELEDHLQLRIERLTASAASNNRTIATWNEDTGAEPGIKTTALLDFTKSLYVAECDLLTKHKALATTLNDMRQTKIALGHPEVSVSAAAVNQHTVAPMK